MIVHGYQISEDDDCIKQKESINGFLEETGFTKSIDNSPFSIEEFNSQGNSDDPLEFKSANELLELKDVPKELLAEQIDSQNMAKNTNNLSRKEKKDKEVLDLFNYMIEALSENNEQIKKALEE